MFGDNFYAEFQVETVYNSGNFRNELVLGIVDSNGIKGITNNGSSDNPTAQNGFLVRIDYDHSSSLNAFVLEYKNGSQLSDSGNSLVGSIVDEGNYYSVNSSASTKYAFAVGYDSTTKEMEVYFYSYMDNKYQYEGSVKRTLSLDISAGYKFEITCIDLNNSSPTDAPCVNVKANFGSETFLFPDKAEPYMYEMEEIRITENPDINIYINSDGPKTGTVKVRKGSNVSIEAKSKDPSLQNYVRLYVTPED